VTEAAEASLGRTWGERHGNEPSINKKNTDVAADMVSFAYANIDSSCWKLEIN
jgi:hypothetical protein